MNSISDRDGLIWFDGEMLPWREAKVHVLTHSLHYGVSFFEGIRAYQTEDGRTAIFRLNEHIERLLGSAHIYQMPVSWSKSEFVSAIIEVVRQNKLSSCYIRPIIFYGSNQLGISPKSNVVHAAIAAWNWGAYLGDDGLEKGIRVKTSSFCRHHSNAMMPRAKIASAYSNSILANQEAISLGYDEALLLDTQGMVAEGPGENLFIIKDGIIYEPQLSSALMGITRSTIIELAKNEHIPFVSKPITRDEIYTADEAFFTGTAAEVTPIRELDDRTIGQGTAGPITKKLQQKYFDLVSGRIEQNHSWLTFI